MLREAWSKGLRQAIKGREGTEEVILRVLECLTDVVVFPQVTDRHVASQQHSYSADATFLHINVLVVVSVMAWTTGRQRRTG